MSLTKIAGKNAKRQRDKIAAKVQRKVDAGGKLGDLSNGEMHSWNRARTKYHGKNKNKKAGRADKGFANWAKEARSEPGSDVMGTGGAGRRNGKNVSYKDYKKNTNAGTNNQKPISERLDDYRKRKASGNKSGTQNGSKKTNNARSKFFSGNNKPNGAPKTTSAPKVKAKGLGLKHGLLIGGAGLGLMGAAEYIKNKKD